MNVDLQLDSNPAEFLFCDGFGSGTDPASKVKEGRISEIFGSQVASRVHYCKRDEGLHTTAVTK